MPTYDYECGSCQHKEEVRQGMSEPKLVTCPCCKRDTFNRQIGTGIVTNRALYGSEAESLMFRVNRDQVPEMRRRFSDKARGAIRDDGSVVYNDRNEARAFGREWDNAVSGATTAVENRSGAGASVDNHAVAE